jgi:hypothetical protein
MQTMKVQEATVSRALLKAMCIRLGYRPDQVVRMSLMPDRVTVDLVTIVGGMPLEWTETRRVTDR